MFNFAPTTNYVKSINCIMNKVKYNQYKANTENKRKVVFIYQSTN